MYVVVLIHGGFQLIYVVDLNCFLGLQEITCKCALCMC